jgi:hypothetical protein
LLLDRRDALDTLAHTLLDRETVDMDEAYAAAGLPVPEATMLEPRPEPATPRA